MEGSQLIEFYKDKNILVTGGTGFVGKLLIEKLLRVCKPRNLFLLIRSKKNVDPEARLNDIFNSPVFEELKCTTPDFKSRVTLVPGDLMEADLGLSAQDRAYLQEVVQIVFHSAATVKFDEAIPVATKINVIGTKSILELCKGMKDLQSMVHVSTFFSNCPQTKIDEEFYDPPLSTQNLIKLTECLKDHQIEKITPYILDKWPNTYAFTKAIAEDTVKTYGKGLPIAVFRPAIIISTRKEPISGWIDNLYGPTGVTVGYGAGIIRTARIDKNSNAVIVPADMTINCLLAVGYKTSFYQSDPDIPIYNFTTHKDNQLKWQDFLEICAERGSETPSSKALWYYTVTTVSSKTALMFTLLFYHILPALLVDTVLVAVNKKPRALKIYKKIHKFIDVIAYFACRNWDFGNDNVNSLWYTLNKTDKELFDFDMSRLDWRAYLRDTVDGLRLYMFEEKPDTLKTGRRKQFWFWILHRLIQVVFFGSIGWGLLRIKSLII